MTTLLPKDPVIDALAEEVDALDDLLSELLPDEWKAPSPCPGWDVQANVAHIIGTESMMAGVDAPATEEDLAARGHVRNEIGGFNEVWVAGLADTPPAEVLDRFRDITAQRLGALRAMDQEAWDAEGFTPAGKDSHGRFMRIRVFDCWMHEQDIRDATGRPGHLWGPAVDQVLDEMSASLGFVVGKLASAPDGSSVTFAIDGEVDRQIHVLVDGRASVVDALDGPATVTIRTDVHTFSRLAGGRVSLAAVSNRVSVEGDEDLGHRVVENLSYTI
ncbi:maleylpyruvate isomerase family mycothiol-dependent enzyme [soil metagenome]